MGNLSVGESLAPALVRKRMAKPCSYCECFSARTPTEVHFIRAVGVTEGRSEPGKEAESPGRRSTSLTSDYQC